MIKISEVEKKLGVLQEIVDGDFRESTSIPFAEHKADMLTAEKKDADNKIIIITIDKQSTYYGLVARI